MAVTTNDQESLENASEGQLAGTIQELVDYCIVRGVIPNADRIWAYNAVLEAVGATGPGPQEAWAFGDSQMSAEEAANFDLEACLATLSDTAVANGCAMDSVSGRDRASMRIMGVLTPRPSEVAQTFGRIRDAEGAKAATDYFYQLSCDVGYVRRAAIARNVQWSTPTRWGDLEITINLSKPEKDPRDIAAAGAAKKVDTVYPACQLCMENEGYPGRAAGIAGPEHPARQNLRIIPIELGGERWGLQYSPYAYFNEHCIAMSSEHRLMHIDRAALNCLFDFVDLIPHYFIGSNADLPIVGGSILSHDHFQGGAHEFPMMRATVATPFTMAAYPDVEGAVLTWPLTVLRLRSASRAQILDAATHVIDTWRAYSDESVNVVAFTNDGVRHNTVTPVVRRIDQGEEPYYEVYLALRCNITSEEHPMGVFHPHAELHHIKKENIGLIEVMGLAILPPRLVNELAAVRSHLLDACTSPASAKELRTTLDADPLSASHAAWAEDIYERRADELTDENAESILHEEVGQVFGLVLEDAGVFKWDDAGRAAQARFLEAL